MNLEQMTLFGDPLDFASVQRRMRADGSHITQRRRGAKKSADGRGRPSNSLAARGDERLQAALTGRRAEIVAWLREHGPATDREIVAGLYFEGADMNLVRPRVTELLGARAVEEIDRVRDSATGMMVRRVNITERASRPGEPRAGGAQ